jgi:hypothetical protein
MTSNKCAFSHILLMGLPNFAATASSKVPRSSVVQATMHSNIEWSEVTGSRDKSFPLPRSKGMMYELLGLHL